MAESALAIILLAVIALLGLRAYDRLQVRRLLRLRELADDFYERAGMALDDPRMNPGILDFVTLVVDAVAKPANAWMWARGMLEARHRPVPSDPKSNPLFEESDLGAECVHVMIAGLLLLAEIKPVPGLVIRREVLSLKRKMARDPAKAPPVVSRWVKNERRLEAA